MRRAGFRLTKYYLDCIAADGEVFIGYAARLAWGRLALRYAAVLACDAKGGRTERHTYTGVTEPAVLDGAVQWVCPALTVSGEWRPLQPRQDARLYEAGGRRIDWCGVAPRATAAVTGAQPLAGAGYVERLELTVEPWRLPFDTLHWGRYHGGADTLFWIGWDGATTLRRSNHNGRWLTGGSFEGEVLHFAPDTELRLEARRVVHEGPILGAIADLPRLLQRIPPAFAAARETKWVSRACLQVPGGTSSGWALHETVHFR